MDLRVHSVDEFMSAVTDLRTPYTIVNLKVVRSTHQKNKSVWVHGLRERGSQWVTIVGCGCVDDKFALDCTLDIMDLESHDLLFELFTDCIVELGWRVPKRCFA